MARIALLVVLALWSPLAGIQAEGAERKPTGESTREQHTPMPLPTGVDQLAPLEPVGTSRLVTRNILTREVVLGPLAPATMRISWGAETGSAGAFQPHRSSFDTPSVVSEPDIYPWSAGVKIFGEARDDTGSPFLYECSGTLIDSLHVITASHCVFLHDIPSLSITVNDWAEEIRVVPGYENGNEPFGDANAVELHSWSGWIDDADYDHDIGIIDLDRAVGALSGWHGYTRHGLDWSDSCNFFTGSMFRHVGYPDDGSFDGELMYTDVGSYDSCESTTDGWHGNEIRFDRGSYEGQNGSGSYRSHADCPNCSVFAVLSNGTSTYTDDVRITNAKYWDIVDVIQEDNYLRLIPLRVQASPAATVAGRQLSSLSFVLHLPLRSWGPPYTGTLCPSVYLSIDDQISTEDRLVGTPFCGTPFSIVPGGAGVLEARTPPTIPSDTPTGGYYLGLIMSRLSGGLSASGQDAFPIHVTGAPNLAVPTISVSDDNPTQGEVFELNATVLNDGNGDSAPTTLRYYRSIDATISESDIQVETDPIPGLPPGGTSPEEVSIIASPFGTYWFGGCVDAVPDEMHTWDNCSNGIEVTIDCSAADDLWLSDLTVDAEELFEACGTITLGPNFLVEEPAGQALMRAGEAVVFLDGVSVEQGGILTVEIPELL